MATIDVAQVESTFVIHFKTEGNRINACTLASTLVNLADAAKAANQAINPGFDIEIVVEALAAGSFRALLRPVYTPTRNLFSSQTVQATVLNLIAAFIWERVFATRDQVKVEVRSDEVMIEHGTDRVIVPRNVYDSTRAAELSETFRKGIGRTLETIAADQKVTGIAFLDAMDSSQPEVLIDKTSLQAVDIGYDHGDQEPDTRFVEENCDLQIVKAILERGSRKWEFMWCGVRSQHRCSTHVSTTSSAHTAPRLRRATN